MSQAILGLVAGFILVLVLLLVLMLRSAINWQSKLVAVLVASGFYWIQYSALVQYAGWPSAAALPNEFVLIASHIREPNPASGDPGVMYWWVAESNDRQVPPRVYRLPYRVDLHQAGDQVVQEQKQGKQYVGRTLQKSVAGDGGFGVAFERISKNQRYQKK